MVDYERELDRDQFVAFRDALFRLLLLRDIEVQKMALHAVVRLYPQIAPYYSGDVVSEMRAKNIYSFGVAVGNTKYGQHLLDKGQIVCLPS